MARGKGGFKYDPVVFKLARMLAQGDFSLLTQYEKELLYVLPKEPKQKNNAL